MQSTCQLYNPSVSSSVNITSFLPQSHVFQSHRSYHSTSSQIKNSTIAQHHTIFFLSIFLTQYSLLDLMCDTIKASISFISLLCWTNNFYSPKSGAILSEVGSHIFGWSSVIIIISIIMFLQLYSTCIFPTFSIMLLYFHHHTTQKTLVQGQSQLRYLKLLKKFYQISST